MFDPIFLSYAIALAVGLAAGLIATWLVRAISRKIDFVDRPDGDRKKQKAPVALGGGIAVYAASLTGIALSYAYARSESVDILKFIGDRPDLPFVIALLQASLMIVVLGLLDDRFAMRGRWKLLGQFACAGWLVYSGLQIDKLGIFGEVYDLGWWGVPLTMFWLLAAINAINLIDGIDGLASSVGTVICLTMATIAAMKGHFAHAVIMLSLAGSLIGFLRFNFAPASIYLGDTGSMLIGLIVGAVTAHTSVKSPAVIAMAVPLAVLSIPILDSGAAILRRKLTGRSLFAADRGHLHHSLLIRGWSVQQASMFITLICATTCLSAVLSVMWNDERIAVGIVLAVVMFLAFTKTFGHIEFGLVKDTLHKSAISLAPVRSETPQSRQSIVRLQGSREWDKLWEAMTESAEGYGLVKMKLSINIPSLHEVFFASWETAKKSAIEPEKLWTVLHPLMLDGQKVGHIELYGMPDSKHKSTPAHLIQVLDFLEPVEDDVRRICEQILHDEKSTERTAATEATPGDTGQHDELSGSDSSRGSLIGVKAMDPAAEEPVATSAGPTPS